ncbi:hypothetical protein D3C78_1890790 [compost metagenome]
MVKMNLMLRQQSVSNPSGNLSRISHVGSSNGGSGYGTMNVQRRIQLHCGEAFGLRYVEASEGTCVEVVLPRMMDRPL